MVVCFMLENSECSHREPVHVSSSSMYIALDGAEDINIVIDKAYALTHFIRLGISGGCGGLGDAYNL